MKAQMRAPVSHCPAPVDNDRAMMGPMNRVVDPTPLIEERLRSVTAEHEPSIKALEGAIANATLDEARDLKMQLRRARRTYAAARWDVEQLRGPGVVW
jgi:hypothetical protein